MDIIPKIHIRKYLSIVLCLFQFKTSEAQRILDDAFKRIQEHKFKTVVGCVTLATSFLDFFENFR